MFRQRQRQGDKRHIESTDGKILTTMFLVGMETGMTYFDIRKLKQLIVKCRDTMVLVVITSFCHALSEGAVDAAAEKLLKI